MPVQRRAPRPISTAVQPGYLRHNCAALALTALLRHVTVRIVAKRFYYFELAQLFGIARDRFAADKKLIAARTFYAHAIQVLLLATPLYRSLRAGCVKLC